jgi:putative ABC transport system permease protein
MPGPIDIGYFDLLLACAFVVLAGVFSVVWSLGLVRDLAIGTLRTFAQLFLMGYLLKVIFNLEMVWLVLLVFLVMVSMAAHIIRGRVKEKRVDYLLPAFVAMLISYFAVSVTVTGVVVGADPWWSPQYFIPLAGMIIGNSMSALAIGLDRLFSDLAAKRDIVEMKLAHGATYVEASESIVRDAIKAGMIPSINSMMGVGIVFLPGMMTGQILAGADPITAIEYQIVVMLMLVASAAIGTVVVVLLARRRCFTAGQAPVLRHENDA